MCYKRVLKTAAMLATLQRSEIDDYQNARYLSSTEAA
jgi:hypothetical protein